MAEHDTWMPLYIGDYLKDTMMLTLRESGAYLHLIMAYWVNKGPLPDDDDKLSSITKSSQSDWFAIRKTISKYFVIKNGFWHHGRIDEELTKASKITQDRKNAGLKGNQKRWGNRKPVANGIANSSQTLSQTDPPSPSPSQGLLRSPPVLRPRTAPDNTPLRPLLTPEEYHAAIAEHKKRKSENPDGNGRGDHGPVGDVPKP